MDFLPKSIIAKICSVMYAVNCEHTFNCSSLLYVTAAVAVYCLMLSMYKTFAASMCCLQQVCDDLKCCRLSVLSQ